MTALSLLFLLIRGLHYPDGRTTPWYTSPGFIVGIPAVPFIMPFLLASSCSGARVKSRNRHLPPPAVTDLIVLDDQASAWP